jgi:hypothetical protein
MSFTIHPLLISGDDNDLHDFEDEHCVIVDWREMETDLVGYVMRAIPEAGLSFTGDEAKDIMLAYKDKTLPVGLTHSPGDRYITIRAMNKVLEGDFEMRLFRVTYFSDTHMFYVQSAAWWQEAERLHPQDMERVFQRVDEGLDFP